MLLYLAVDRILHQDYDIHPQQMLVVAALGVLFNVIMGLVLAGACGTCHVAHTHSHAGGHGHSHDVDDVRSTEDASSVSVREPRVERNMNIRAALVHVIGDLIQSVGVLVAAVVIMINPEWKIADPVCTILFSAIVLCTTALVLRDICCVFMEAVPPQLDYRQVLQSLSDIEGVRHAHSLHIWALSSEKHAVSVHLALAPGGQYNDVVRRASQTLRVKHGAFHSTVQVETFDDVMDTCPKCAGP